VPWSPYTLRINSAEGRIEAKRLAVISLMLAEVAWFPVAQSCRDALLYRRYEATLRRLD